MRKVFFGVAERRIQETANFVSGCATGTMLASRSEIGLMLDLARDAKETIQAVTSYRDLGWWASPVGEEFITIQKSAIVAVPKLTISRIMIVSGESPDNEEIKTMRSLTSTRSPNRSPRMSVSWVPISTARATSCDVNLTIIDDRFAHQDVEIGPDEPQQHRYSVDRAEISQARGKFEELQLHATQFV
jgi:hypothetical protein